MVIKNAIITSATINDGDRGLLTAWLQLDYGNGSQVFGGYALYLPKSYAHHAVLSHAGHFIYRCMEIAGVKSWSEIVGMSVRARLDSEFGHILEIGHIIKDDWFNPSKDFGNS